MKTTIFNSLVFFFLCVFNSVSLAQDLIIQKNKDTILCKITEIKQHEVIYKKIENLSGPNYVKEIKNLEQIVFENGVKESFEGYVDNRTINTNNNYKNNFLEKIVIKRNRYYYSHSFRKINKRDFVGKLSSSKNPEVMERYLKSKKIQTISYILGFSSIPVYYSSAIMILDYPLASIGTFFLGTGMLVTNIVTLQVYKKERNKAVMLYNESLNHEETEEDYF
jgi:hypothetical protein